MIIEIFLGALLTDLSKAFEWLSLPWPLIAKLNAQGFRIASLRLLQNCLSNHKERTNVNSDFSSCEEILFGVPQVSILGPLLFYIFLCDLFFIMNETNFASYSDDNTPDVVGNNIEDVIIKLQIHHWHFISGFMIIKWKLIQANAISFVAQMTKLT